MRKPLCLALPVVLALGLIGCGGPVGSVSQPLSPSAGQGAPAGTDFEGQMAVEGTLQERLTAFACNTAGAMVDAGENSCYSPASLYMALALVSAGAGGETLDQLLAVLGAEDVATLNAQMTKAMAALPFDGYQEALADYAAGLLDIPEGLDEEALAAYLPGEEAGSRLELGNSVWLNSLKYKSYLRDFEKTAAGNYVARLENLPFGEAATDEALNGWIKEHTGDRIDPGLETDPEKALYLVNTVYYLDGWVSTFNAAQNTTEPFRLADGTGPGREYMNKTVGEHQYYRGEGYAASYLALKHGRMTFILPDEGVAPAELLATPDTIAAMLAPEEWETAEVVFQIPKFTFETALEPMEALKDMGLNLPFDPSQADLTDFTELAEGENLFISEILQQTYIRVDEVGAEAAAVTSIEVGVTAAPLEEPPAFELRLTRPFIFMLERDLVVDGEYQGRAPLFIGVVSDPGF